MGQDKVIVVVVVVIIFSCFDICPSPILYSHQQKIVYERTVKKHDTVTSVTRHIKQNENRK